MDFSEIKKASENYLPQMTRFLRDLIKIPGESCTEEGVIRRIEAEMKAVGFDKVEIDKLGNVLGYMGSGKRIIAYDAHIDTVGLGEMSNWEFDPYEGYETEELIAGRGASDQLGGIVSSVYGAKIMKDLGLIPEDVTVLVTGTVQEEDCDGMCWQYIHTKDGITPEFVVITEPTNGNIYRGHRGRMEIRVEVKGISCHGSAPERGENAIYKMAEIINEVKELNNRLAYDPFLGKGTLTVTQIFYTSPSRCAVADMCAISIDRRLTVGENDVTSINEIKELPSVKKYGAEVTMYNYNSPSWTGEVFETECYFPTWVIPEDHPACRALAESFRGMYGEPKIDKWTFSTNGVSIMGRYGIPCVGLGPGKEEEAHAPNEKTWKADLVKCAAVYAGLPSLYVKK
ncbi:MAG: putative succinyl-diaminopimelate desuccinylase [Firmicutes bacterium ADurb.Bin182]|nr:MAG: putative succinyl-diaminopimelate desuccinylase [Firmicutes bacterium ADurb.Bin182]